MAHPRIEAWFKFALGTKLNPDLAYGLQCVDTIDHYGAYLFGVPWQQCVGVAPGGAAKNMFDSMPSKYWIKVRNDPKSATQLPPRGAVLILDGWATQIYGHTGVLDKATAFTFTMMQQDGFAPPLIYANGGWYSNKPTHRATYTWPGLAGGFPGRLIGWCIPRENMIVGTPTVKTTMDGIDISSHQKGIRQALVPAEFVIVKTTGGNWYVNPAFESQLADARADGAFVGVYHFMRDGGVASTAAQEAAHFLKHAGPHIDRQTIVVLDFEHKSLLNAAGIAMAREWIRIVKEATGKKWIIVYANLSHANMDWSALHNDGQNKLWLAQYPAGTATQGYGPKISRGTPRNWHVVCWQYSQYGRLPGYSGNLDLNLFYGNVTQWNQYAAPAAAEPAGGLGSEDAEFDAFMELLMSWYKSKAEFEDRMRALPWQYRGLHPDAAKAKKGERDPRDAYSYLRNMPYLTWAYRMASRAAGSLGQLFQAASYLVVNNQKAHANEDLLHKVVQVLGVISSNTTASADELRAQVRAMLANMTIELTANVPEEDVLDEPVEEQPALEEAPAPEEK